MHLLLFLEYFLVFLKYFLFWSIVIPYDIYNHINIQNKIYENITIERRNAYINKLCDKYPDLQAVITSDNFSIMLRKEIYSNCFTSKINYYIGEDIHVTKRYPNKSFTSTPVGWRKRRDIKLCKKAIQDIIPPSGAIDYYFIQYYKRKNECMFKYIYIA